MQSGVPDDAGSAPGHPPLGAHYRTVSARRQVAAEPSRPRRPGVPRSSPPCDWLRAGLRVSRSRGDRSIRPSWAGGASWV